MDRRPGRVADGARLPGRFGGAVNAPFVWIRLCVLFVLPFLRPPLRLLHLDLLVLLAFSVSLAFFNAAELGVSIPIVYPLLAYLLARMLQIAWRPPRRATAAGCWSGRGSCSVAVVFLVGFRVALNVVDGNVIDVGYAGVIGADRLAGGDPLYGAFPPDNPHGDTYGPVAYAAYVPFEAAFPWSGTWDDLPAAHAAAVAFDLGCALLLFLIGRRLRDRDARPAARLPVDDVSVHAARGELGRQRLARRPAHPRRAARRRAAAGARGAGRARRAHQVRAARARAAVRHVPAAARALAAAAFAGTAALALAPFDVATAFERTVGFQSDRDSPFSIWGYYELPDALQSAVQAAARAAGPGARRRAAAARRRDARGPRRRGADRAAAGGRPLVLPLPRVVRPAGVDRAAQPSGAGRSTCSIESARPGCGQRISTALIHGSSSAAS